MSKELKKFSQTKAPARRQPAHGQIRQQIQVSGMEYDCNRSQEEHDHDHSCELAAEDQKTAEASISFDSISESNQKIYIIENLGCANCAAKMERMIQEILK